MNYLKKYYAPDTTVGLRLELDANDGLKTLQNLKKEIQDAKGDLVAMAEKYGDTSDQARAAAKRVAELTDALGDAKALTDTFNPDQKFVALGQAINGVLGGFTALTGAMGLLGVESEEVQKQLLKVQSALALSQGLNQIGDSINSFKTFGKTIVDTFGKGGAIGLAIAGVAALGAAIFATTNRNKELEASQEEYIKALVETKIEVANVRQGFDNARKGIISKQEALDNYNKTLGQTIGEAKTLNEAERLTAANAETYVKVQAMKAQANYLLQISAKKAADAMLAQDDYLFKTYGKGSVIGGALRSQLKAMEDDAAMYEKKAQELFTKIGEMTRSAGFKPAGGSTGKVSKPSDEPETAEAYLARTWYNIRSKQEQDEEAHLRRRLDLQKSFHDNRARMAKGEMEREKNEMIESVNAQIDATNKKMEDAERERQMRVNAARDIGSALGSLSEIVGKQTAAGKVLGIAQATINTFIGATEVLRAKSTLPEPFGTIAKIANVAAIIASGIAAVKNIIKVQVPGASGSAGAGALQSAQSTSAPLQPQSVAQRTRLDADQLNQIGNATVRAFVVESDVTGSQQRIRRLNRAARI